MKAAKSLIMVLALWMAASCAGKSTEQSDNQNIVAQVSIIFDADSAYSFVAQQCAFGSRVPNSDAHKKCGNWLADKLRSYGASVTEQCADLKAYDGTVLHARNIIGEFHKEKTERVLLIAHWDCRPWADNDPDPNNPDVPVMGANDGASGVGVLIEIARVISTIDNPNVGIDILLVDAEDWGETGGNNENSWALGAQYWTAHPHRADYRRPTYGILLDMVGDENAAFLQEYYSRAYAPTVMDKIWKAAAELGYSNRFINSHGGAVTDDHVVINRAGIPCIDIIDQRKNSDTGFCEQWHTVDDQMSHISTETLKAVGQTIIYALLEKQQ